MIQELAEQNTLLQEQLGRETLEFRERLRLLEEEVLNDSEQSAFAARSPPSLGYGETGPHSLLYTVTGLFLRDSARGYAESGSMVLKDFEIDDVDVVLLTVGVI